MRAGGGGGIIAVVGAIIQARGETRGMTTGAGMWRAGAIGGTVGPGRLAVAAAATLIGLVVILVLRRAEALALTDRRGHDGAGSDGQRASSRRSTSSFGSQASPGTSGTVTVPSGPIVAR